MSGVGLALISTDDYGRRGILKSQINKNCFYTRYPIAVLSRARLAQWLHRPLGGLRARAKVSCKQKLIEQIVIFLFLKSKRFIIITPY